MEFIKKWIVYVTFLVMLSVPLAYAETEQLRVTMNEFIDQRVVVDPLETGAGIWFDSNENQSYYNLSGYIIVQNQNPNETLADIYVSLSNTNNISLPTLYAGRNGTFVSNDTSSGLIVLHIPELRPNENSTWLYSITNTSIRPPLNLTTTYSATKLLAGDNLTLTDTLQNSFDNFAFQTSTCIYDITINQTTNPVNLSNSFYNFTFFPTTLNGTDPGNVSFSNLNKTMFWNVLNTSCLNLGATTFINYTLSTPYNIPNTQSFPISNSTLTYSLNSTISHLRVVDITGISDADIAFSKRIVAPSHPTLFGSNVSWNVSGYFNTTTNLTYNLTHVSFWVSQRNVNGSFTDPNTYDNDSVTNTTLQFNLTPGVLVNLSNPFQSSAWVFNYSDIPSPIVWMNVNFTINNDGVQLINRSVTRNNNDLYIKNIYLILGYWLEIEKNITSIAADTYAVRIDVINKGNQVTPANTVVTIYDFVPVPFNYSSFNISTSPWYLTSSSNTTINGNLNGTLLQWGIIPNNALNTSFAPGPAPNENTSWSVEFNVTGTGDYQVLDVFVTGLDPQQVDGAGSSKAVVISEIVERLKSTEGIFAIAASILLLIGLLL